MSYNIYSRFILIEFAFNCQLSCQLAGLLLLLYEGGLLSKKGDHVLKLLA